MGFLLGVLLGSVFFGKRSYNIYSYTDDTDNAIMCFWCGNDLTSRQKKFCCVKCKKLYKAEKLINDNTTKTRKHRGFVE